MVHVLGDGGLIAAAGCDHGGTVFALEFHEMDRAATAIHECLELCADAEDIIGAGQCQAVSLPDFCPDLLERVFLGAASLFVASVATQTRFNRIPF